MLPSLPLRRWRSRTDRSWSRVTIFWATRMCPSGAYTSPPCWMRNASSSCAGVTSFSLINRSPSRIGSISRDLSTSTSSVVLSMALAGGKSDATARRAQVRDKQGVRQRGAHAERGSAQRNVFVRREIIQGGVQACRLDGAPAPAHYRPSIERREHHASVPPSVPEALRGRLRR